ncbi:putative 3,4-dihydroxy-2-butanone kinase [Nicotiana attenuata]|uniref:3,4-dihydroxy-2-butanone kinase n=1 Tax=Nicotiana attenuata TaxID=49451 RepID=A0A1J6JUQ1_NICAT|nr:putative 3,4-dihydroxy-2-butanone kinase [Nicotiana attenuata]
MAFQSKKLINDPNDVVTEFIEGLIETYPGLQYLDGFPEVKVVLRADVSGEKYDKVAVISGIEFELCLCLYFNTGTCFLLVALHRRFEKKYLASERQR